MSAFTIHKSQYYAAHLMSCGLVIESTRKAGGVNMKPDHPQFADYLEAFRSAIDLHEADLLCKALLS